MQKKFGLSNIRVNAVAPGAIDTDMNKNLTKEEITDLEKEIPLNRMGIPQDIANGVYMLIENEYITGQVITIDRRLDKIKKKCFYDVEQKLKTFVDKYPKILYKNSIYF